MTSSKKIVLIGHFGVGKSSLIRRFVENTFTDSYKVTIGVHIFKKEVTTTSKNTINLVIWDLEGNDDIHNTRESYLLGTSGFIYVFDLSRPDTYKNLTKELNYLKEKQPKVPVKVVGNKKDLVTREFLKQNNETFKPIVDYFTSAKTGQKVEDLFITLAKELTQ